ncbi:hypothetical protein L6172_17350 [Thalassospiraceae bacterium SW-3-3]|nr:hypothetical protein L6172_17350 [Thalassospiraceae bacterium SW-3-3]
MSPKALSLLKDVAVAASFGASQSLDIYLMAFVLIGVPVSVIVVALQTTLIPSLVAKDSGPAAILLGSMVQFSFIALLVALPIWLLLLPFAFEIFYANKSETGSHSALLSACFFLIPYYFVNGANLLFYGALQARKVFWPNALFPGLFPLAILTSVWFMPNADIHSLLFGTIAGSILEGTALIGILRHRKMLRFKRIAGSGLKPVVKLALPLIAGGIIASFSPVIEQLIAFHVGPGSVSLLSFGNKVPGAINSLLLTAIGIVILPHFSELVSKQEWCESRKLHLKLSFIVWICGAVVATVGITFSETIIKFIFERGAFTTQDTQQTSEVMQIYLMQLPFMLTAMVSIRALVAMGKTLTMTWVTSAQLILAASLSYVLSGTYNVPGIAAGTTVATICGAFVLTLMTWYRFEKQSRNLST